ncbi:hypothetical protein CVD27_04205 [Neobacillus cucumis]|uniref:Uncharacterized protein n=1 Tax=Neobacillus cucumis TaxID=1740721 RepID=A0A2N5HSY8_9BACI|nr:hypothetical protein CVD27_04205 [Neobacillus cucumis]
MGIQIPTSFKGFLVWRNHFIYAAKFHPVFPILMSVSTILIFSLFMYKMIMFKSKHKTNQQ